MEENNIQFMLLTSEVVSGIKQCYGVSLASHRNGDCWVPHRYPSRAELEALVATITKWKLLIGEFHDSWMYYWANRALEDMEQKRWTTL